MELINSNGISVCLHIVNNCSIDKLSKYGSISTWCRKGNVFNISLSSFPAGDQSFLETFGCKNELALESACMSAMAFLVFYFRFLTIIFSFEYFLPPWFIISFELYFHSSFCWQFPSFSHIFLYPHESIFVIFDRYRAIHPSCNLLPNVIQNRI